MAIWERYDGTFSLTAVGDDSSTIVLQNQEDTDNFQNADLVVVDAILTLITDTDDLVGFRTLIRDIGGPSVSEDDPIPSHPDVWYEWFTARGPVIHRIRSKRTIPPFRQLQVQAWKARGANATNVHWGLRVLVQLKH